MRSNRAGPALAPVLALAPIGALLCWWSLDDGGYDPLDWQPGALVVLVLAAMVIATPAAWARRPTRRLQVALGALAAYTAWSYLSISWAGDAGTALEGAHRTALYLGVAVVAGLAAPPAGVLRGAAIAVAAIIGAAAVVTLVRIAGADAATPLFTDGRLYSPLGYFNADAAFWSTGALLGCVAASQRETPDWVRPPLLGLAAIEVGLAVLAASRGWLFTLPLVLLATLLLVPARLRLLVAVAVTGLAVLPVVGRLLDPVDAVGGLRGPQAAAAVIAAAQDVVVPLVLSGLAAAAAATVWLLVDRRLVLSQSAARVVGRGVVVVALVGAVGGAATALVVVTDPVDRVDRAWQEFKANDTQTLSGASRLTAAGSSRYDFWRVSVDLVKKHPLAGIGQDNFAVPYVARRSIDYEEPRWVHSLPLRVLVHTGVVGALLLVVALVALFAGAVRRGGGGADDRAAAALALVPLVVWTLHGSVDWFWEYPVLSVTALGLAAAAGSRPRDVATPAVADAGAAAAAGAAADAQAAAEGDADAVIDAAPVDPGAPAPAWAARARVASRAGAVAVAAAGVLAVGAAYVAGRDVELASKHWPADPPRAFERLDQAASLSPSAQPYLVEGVIALRRGDLGRARRAFADAADRNPGDWFARFELGMVAVAAGDRRAADAAFTEAARRNPKDTIVKTARRKLAAGEGFSVAEADQLFAQRATRFSGK